MYIKKLKSLSLNNKYSRICFNIIDNALRRDCLEGYFEKHHILPKSFELGGETDPNNIVKLTFREHYIIHKLLTKIIIDKKFRKKMYFALWQMSNRYVCISSRQYEYAKNIFSIHMKEHMKDLWKDQEYKDKMYESREWYYKDKDRQKEHSEYLKELMKDSEYKKICVDPMREAHKYIDHTSKEWTERSFNSPEAKAKAAERARSEEGRIKASMRELNKGDEFLSDRGKNMAKIAFDNGVAKFGSEELYRAHLSNRIKGRVKMLNVKTREIKMIRNPQDMSSDWIILKKLSKEEREFIICNK